MSAVRENSFYWTFSINFQDKWSKIIRFEGIQEVVPDICKNEFFEIINLKK